MKILAKLLIPLIAIIFIACGNDEDSSKTINENTLSVLKIGASPNPHAKILENIKSDLKNKGIDLQIIEFSDYVLPNLSLDDGSIDANFYQHQPYLDKMVEDKKLHIESIAKVHIEPLGFYSKKIKNIDELKLNSIIAIPNDPSNGGRALILLHNNGLIKLKDPLNLYATELDIIENPKKIKIKQLEAAMLPKVVADIEGAVINGNYALQTGMTSKEALLLEDSKSPYANVLVVKSKDVNKPEILILKDTLLSPKTKEFINDTYKGEIVSVF